MSDSSLLWLPAGRYDSVRPLWQEGYVWSPLPVDNSLPLHQTSFLDIDEREAASAARSRATTLRSRASTQTLPGEMPRGDTARRSSLAETGQSEQETTTPLQNSDGTIRKRRTSRRASAAGGQTNPDADSTLTRLRSFHLGDKLQETPDKPAGTARTRRPRRKSQAGTQGGPDEDPGPDERSRQRTPSMASQRTSSTMSQRTPSLTSQETLSTTSEEQPADVDAQGIRPSRSVTRRRRNGAGRRNSAASSLQSATQGDVELPAVMEEPDPQPPMPTASSGSLEKKEEASKRLAVKLDLNLEVEVELKVKLQGDLTLTLFS